MRFRAFPASATPDTSAAATAISIATASLDLSIIFCMSVNLISTGRDHKVRGGYCAKTKGRHDGSPLYNPCAIAAAGVYASSATFS